MGQTPPSLGVAAVKVYIIHGWTYSLDKWSELCKLLRARGIEPVLLKVPGLTTPSSKVWDIAGYIEWLDGELKAESHPIVIGHSNGGRIALSYVQQHPGRLQQLILIDNAGVAHNQASSKLKLKILRGLSTLGKPLARAPLLKKIFYKLIGAQDYFNAPPNMKLTMGNMLKADQTIDFAAVRLPTTIIWGRDDAITPLSDGEKIHQFVAGSKLTTIDNARHAPFFTQANKVADIIVEALEGKGSNS